MGCAGALAGHWFNASEHLLDEKAETDSENTVPAP